MAVTGCLQFAFEEVDSHNLSALERFAIWRETGRLPMAAEPANDDARKRFRIRVRKLSSPTGRFTDMTMTPMRLIRQERHIASDGLDMVSFTLLLSPGVQHQLGSVSRSTVARPGQILVKDFARPAAAWWEKCARSLNFHLPRSTAEGVIADNIGRLHGRVLASNGLPLLFSAQMRTLARIMPRLNNSARMAALEATAALAASVLRCGLGMEIRDEINYPGLYAAAEACIQQCLGSAALSPEFVAHRIGCSRAHLYRVFAARGETVAGLVRELRLQRAHAILAGGMSDGVRIGDVAYRCGFEDPVHFTRLFRARFGLTPRALKAGEGRPGD